MQELCGFPNRCVTDRVDGDSGRSRVTWQLSACVTASQMGRWIRHDRKSPESTLAGPELSWFQLRTRHLASDTRGQSGEESLVSFRDVPRGGFEGPMELAGIGFLSTVRQLVERHLGNTEARIQFDGDFAQVG